MSRTLLVVAALVFFAGCGGSSKSGFPTVGAAKTYHSPAFSPPHRPRSDGRQGSRSSFASPTASH